MNQIKRIFSGTMFALLFSISVQSAYASVYWNSDSSNQISILGSQGIVDVPPIPPVKIFNSAYSVTATISLGMVDVPPIPPVRIFAFGGSRNAPPLAEDLAGFSGDSRGYSGIKRFDKRAVGVAEGEYSGDLKYDHTTVDTPRINTIGNFFGGLPTEFSVSKTGSNQSVPGGGGWSVVRTGNFWTRIRD